PHHQQFLTVDGDLSASILAEEHLIPHRNPDGTPGAIILQLPRANCQHIAFLRFFFRRIGNDNPAPLFLTGFETSHQYVVVQGTKLHRTPPLQMQYVKHLPHTITLTKPQSRSGQLAQGLAILLTARASSLAIVSTHPY